MQKKNHRKTTEHAARETIQVSREEILKQTATGWSRPSGRISMAEPQKKRARHLSAGPGESGFLLGFRGELSHRTLGFSAGAFALTRVNNKMIVGIGFQVGYANAVRLPGRFVVIGIT